MYFTFNAPFVAYGAQDIYLTGNPFRSLSLLGCLSSPH